MQVPRKQDCPGNPATFDCEPDDQDRRHPHALLKIGGTFGPILSYMNQRGMEEEMSQFNDASEMSGNGCEFTAALVSVSRWAGGAVGAALAWYAGRMLYRDGLAITGYLIALNGIWLLLPAISDLLRHRSIQIDDVRSPRPGTVRFLATLIVAWFLVIPWSLR